MRQRITTCFYAPAYRHINGEEGSYDAFCGYNVFASFVEGSSIHYWFYSGRADNLPAVFPNEETAKQMQQGMLAKGWINSECWVCFESKPINELPDYVLNYHKPEYN
jgi:hypothetical protein